MKLRALNTEKLRNLRESKGYSQHEVALHIGYTSRNSYTSVESGKREPELHKLSLLADLFDVTIDDLVR